MNDQLVMLDDESAGGAGGGGKDSGDRRGYHRLDEHTRDIGRKGVALAREALRQAAARAA
jgi:hypothetical protein